MRLSYSPRPPGTDAYSSKGVFLTALAGLLALSACGGVGEQPTASRVKALSGAPSPAERAEACEALCEAFERCELQSPQRKAKCIKGCIKGVTAGKPDALKNLSCASPHLDEGRCDRRGFYHCRAPLHGLFFSAADLA